MSKNEKTPEQKPLLKKAQAVAAAKQAEKKNGSKNKDNTKWWEKVTRFFKDIKSEWKKIVWPKKKQVINNTIVVLVVMAICSVVIWPLDWGLLQLFNLIF